MEEEEEVMVLVNGKEIALDAVTEEHQEQMSKEVSAPLPNPNPSQSLPSSLLVHPVSLPPFLSLHHCLLAPNAVHAGADPLEKIKQEDEAYQLKLQEYE